MQTLEPRAPQSAARQPSPIAQPVPGEPFRALAHLAHGESSPTRRRRWLAISVGLHAAFLAGLLLIPLGPPEREHKPRPVEIVFNVPDRPEPHAPPVQPPAPAPKAAVEPLAPPPRPKPKPEPAKTRAAAQPPAPRLPAPRPKLAPLPARPMPQKPPVIATAPKPKRQVRTGALAGAAPVAPRRAAPTRPAEVRPAFETTETAPAPRRAPTRVVSTAGFGRSELTVPRPATTPEQTGSIRRAAFESDAPAEPGAAQDDRVVARTGFAEPAPDAANPVATGDIQRGGFGDGERPEREARSRRRVAADADQPVEIVSKPRPLYTDQARSKRIEGEVVLEVTFAASGSIRVLRVLDGLGHGLDEAAIAAAEQIEFTPARREGQPIDHTATLRVVFRLA